MWGRSEKSKEDYPGSLKHSKSKIQNDKTELDCWPDSKTRSIKKVKGKAKHKAVGNPVVELSMRIKELSVIEKKEHIKLKVMNNLKELRSKPPNENLITEYDLK
jgi:hypothetical protein